MSLLQTAWEDWTAEVQLPGTVSQTEATDLLQVQAPTLTDQEGDDWFVAVATEYDSLGIITGATYVALRNYVNNNEVGANDLFAALGARIGSLTETIVLREKLDLECNTSNLNNIDGDITTLEGDRDGAATQQLADAYQAGVSALESRKLQLQELT